MAEQIKLELHHTYTPNEWDNALEIDTGFVHVLDFIEKNPGKCFQKAMENTDHKKYPEQDALIDTGLIKIIKSTQKVYTTNLGRDVLEQILQDYRTGDTLCGNMLIMNTSPYPEKSGIVPVNVVTMNAYNEVVKGE